MVNTRRVLLLACIVSTGSCAFDRVVDESESDLAVHEAELKGATGAWASQGPTVINGGQVENLADGTEAAGAAANNPVSGAINTVVTHPTNSNIAYVGAVNGGIWRTANLTAAPPTWTNQTAAFASLSIGALAMDPANPLGLVAGIGRFSSYGGAAANDRRAGGPLNGVMLTFDGATWNTIAPVPALLQGQHISGAAIRNSATPAAARIVVSAQSVTTFGTATFANGGVFLSTDGGTNWRRACRPVDNGIDPACTGPGLPTRGMFNLVEDPGMPTRLYTAAAGGPPANTFGVFISNDSGLNWTNISVNSAALQQVIDAVDGAGTPLSNNVQIAVGQGGRVYVAATLNGVPAYIGFSDDQGVTWTQMDLPLLPSVNGLGGAVVSAQPIAGPGPNAGWVLITTAAPHGLPLNDDVGVRIQAVVGNPAANGDWQVQRQTATTFALVGSASGAGCGGGGGQPACGAAASFTTFQSSNPRPKAGAQGAIHLSLVVDPNTDTTVYLGGDRQNETSGAGNYIGAGTSSSSIFRGDTTQAAGLPQTIPSPQWAHMGHSPVCTAAGCFTPPTLPAGWPGAGQIAGGGSAAGGAAPGSGSAGHADSRGMAFMANGNLIEVGDGGIVLRTNPQNNNGDWFSRNGNLQVTEAHDIAFDSVSGIAMTGNQDTGVGEQTATGSLTWRATQLADGGDVAVDDTQFANTSIRYTSFQSLGNFTRQAYNAANNTVAAPAGSQPNGLVQLCAVGQPAPCLFAVGGSTSPVTPQFKTPIAVNPAAPTNLLVAGASNLWESTNQGANVTNIAAQRVFDMVYGHAANASLIYAMTAAGACPNPGSQLFVRTAAPGSGTPDATLTNVSGVMGAPPAGFQAFDIAVDPSANPNTAYLVGSNCAVAGGGLGTPAVWRFTVTSMPGQAITGTWTNLTGDLGQLNTGTLRTIAYVPAGASPNPKIVVGGDNGVYITADPAAVPSPSGNVFWNELGAASLPNAQVFEMEYEPANDNVYVATMGRGAFSLTNASTINLPPNAECQAAPAPIAADASCQATVTAAAIDGGSYDPDGDPVMLTVLNPGPYGLGTYNVTLQVTSMGGVETCSTTISVTDQTGPTITAMDETLDRCLPQPEDVTLGVSVADNCTPAGSILFNGALSSVDGTPVVPSVAINGQTPLVTLPVGTSTIDWTATDAAGNPAMPVTQNVSINEADTVAACCQPGQISIVGNLFPNVYVLPLGQWCVFGKGSIDTIVTGPGVDFVSGGTSLDVLTTGSIDDVVVGREGSDIINMPIGQGFIYGGDGNDVIEQTLGGVIYGGPGNDSIIGLFGDHFINGGPGFDFIEAGPGDDTVVIYDVCELEPFEVIDGSFGFDTLITPVPLATLASMGVIVIGFDNIVVDASNQHLSECF